MPKRDIRMSGDEIDAFLRTQTKAMILGVAAAGPPEGTVGRLLYRDGRVAFAIRDDDPVVALFDEDARACCVVEQFPSYYEIMGVMLHGRVVRRAGAAVGEAAFDLAVDKTVSFDFAKLQS